MVIHDFIKNAGNAFANLVPWQATTEASSIIRGLVASAGSDFILTSECAVHRTSKVEAGAELKGPCYIGPNCFVSSSALLRGGVWLEADNIVGPGCELKTVFMFSNSKVAHLNFAGDSVIGRDVNVEAGAMLANYRNERTDKAIRFRYGGKLIETGVTKFGAILGDHVRIGANAVIAPGAAIVAGTIVGRLELIDQSQ
jgi:UDP-N-acetylglucosamine diphosphorylase / glucose-1-phosphate thymidylyltransferase / UDP-N-acetylgalactosamine diphosphorylase / glucosamine-1-phosphate N-acetyltransferase / galactosamine-1-phosphate N-acetyltransferase